MVQPPAGHARAVLVVDDDPAILDVLSELLADEGFTVRIARDGYQALVRALELPPDLILTDLMMPFVDGRALLARLHEHPETVHIPVVLMSAGGHQRDGEGFAAFVTKPFNIDALVAELRRHLA